MGQNTITFSFLLLTLFYPLTGFITITQVDQPVCYGGLTTFVCESVSNDTVGFNWLIEHNDINEEEKISRKINVTDITNGDYVTLSMLSIIGLPINNGISIACQGVTSSTMIDTKAVTLTVSDIPPVEDLSIEFSKVEVTATWTEPPYLPEQFVYSVVVTDGSHSRTLNTTDPLCTMPVWSNCSANYSFSVTVIDTGYTHKQSLPAVETKQSNPKELDFIFSEIPSVIFYDYFLSGVFFPVRIIKNCISSIIDAPNAEIQAYFPPGVDVEVPSNLTIHLESEDSETYTGNFSLRLFFESFKAKIFLDFFSGSSEFDISTFNVQNFSLSVTADGLVDMVCTFAVNSSADGCSVAFMSMLSETSGIMTFSIPLAKNEDVALLKNIIIPTGDYDVKVYDVVKASKSIVAAISLTANIVLMQSIAVSSVTSSQTTPTCISSMIVYTTIASSPQPEEQRSTLDFIIPIIIGFLCVSFVLLVIISLLVYHIYMYTHTCTCIKRIKKVGELFGGSSKADNQTTFPMKTRQQDDSTEVVSLLIPHTEEHKHVYVGIGCNRVCNQQPSALRPPLKEQPSIKEPKELPTTCTSPVSANPSIPQSESVGVTPGSVNTCDIYNKDCDYEIMDKAGSLPPNPLVNEKELNSKSELSTATDQNNLQNSIALATQGRAFVTENTMEEEKKESTIKPSKISKDAGVLVPVSTHFPAIPEESQFHVNTSIDAQETSTTKDLTHDKTPSNTVLPSSTSQYSTDAIVSSNLKNTDLSSVFSDKEETDCPHAAEGTAVFDTRKPVPQDSHVDKKTAPRKLPQKVAGRSSDHNQDQNQDQYQDDKSLVSASFQATNDKESTQL